jgi:hypothetical protein
MKDGRKYVDLQFKKLSLQVKLSQFTNKKKKIGFFVIILVLIISKNHLLL